MKKKVIVWCATAMMLLAWISAVQASNDEPIQAATALYSAGGITPYVFQQMDEYLKNKFGAPPNDPLDNWYAWGRGFHRGTSNGYVVYILWDGNYQVFSRGFPSKVVDAGKWTKWLAPLD